MIVMIVFVFVLDSQTQEWGNYCDFKGEVNNVTFEFLSIDYVQLRIKFINLSLSQDHW